jgi:septal ring factor EnvC (AmiA/AmiB activator)
VASLALKLLFVLLVWLLAAPALVGAAAPANDLEGIKKKIANEKKGLSELKLKEGSVRQSLSKIDGDLEKRNRELKSANAKLASITRELEILQAQAAELDRAMALRQKDFARRAAALYRWRRAGSSLSLLKGAQSLGSFLQRAHYLQAALTFDQDLLAQLRETSQRQALAHQALSDKKAELDGQKKALGAAQEAVRQEAEKKKILLASLRQEQQTRSKALRQMEAAALRLQKMLDDISRRAVAKPSEIPARPTMGTGGTTGVGLDAGRGRLEWPVQGKVSAPFGKYKHPEFGAEIVRKGIDIDAPAGEAIHAIERGRVIYASAFSGYGNMVIVDHGARYYSIYGHLGEMTKKSGDELRRGEILGRVGDGDAPSGAKLYFEMRKDGRSVDPLAWLQKY